jgi:hypothetical protein
MKGNYTANEVEALSLDLLFFIKNLRIIEYPGKDGKIRG